MADVWIHQVASAKAHFPTPSETLVDEEIERVNGLLVNVRAALAAIDRQSLAAAGEGHREGGSAPGDLPGEVGVEDVLGLVEQRTVVEAYAVAHRIKHIDLGTNKGRVAAKSDTSQKRVEAGHVLARFKLETRHDGAGIVGETHDARGVVGDVGLNRVKDIFSEESRREKFTGAGKPLDPRVVVLNFRTLEVGVTAVGQAIEGVEVFEGGELAIRGASDGLRPVQPQIEVGGDWEHTADGGQYIGRGDAAAGGRSQNSASRKHLGLEVGLFEAGTAHEAELR